MEAEVWLDGSTPENIQLLHRILGAGDEDAAVQLTVADQFETLDCDSSHSDFEWFILDEFETEVMPVNSDFDDKTEDKTEDFDGQGNLLCRMCKNHVVDGAGFGQFCTHECRRQSLCRR